MEASVDSHLLYWLLMTLKPLARATTILAMRRKMKKEKMKKMMNTKLKRLKIGHSVMNSR